MDASSSSSSKAQVGVYKTALQEYGRDGVVDEFPIRRLYLIFDLAIPALTVMLVVSLARIPGRHRRVAQRGIASRSGLVWRSGLAAVSRFAWPLSVLSLALRALVWKVFVMYQPDLGYWLEAVAMVVFLKGLLEIALIWRVFRQTHQGQHTV